MSSYSLRKKKLDSGTSAEEAPSTREVSFYDKKKKSNLLKKSVVSEEPIGVNYAPQTFISQNLLLIPPERIKIIEYLLYTKPSIVAKRVSSNILPSNYNYKSKTKSVLSIAVKENRSKIALWHSLSRMMGLDKSNIIFSAHEKPAHMGSAPSLYKIRTDPLPEPNFDDGTFCITISETITFELFYLTSIAAVEGTERANYIKEVNEDYWTRLKTYKKMYNIETQTITPLSCDRWNGMKINIRRNSQNQVCVSSIYDTYKMLEGHERGSSSSNMVDSTVTPVLKVPLVYDLEKNDTKVDDSKDELLEASKMVEIVESAEFHQNALYLLRNIDKNVNWKKQMMFLKGNATNPLSEQCNFTYDIDHLWTLRYLNVWGMPVTSVNINPSNPNIVAVGHGMYFLDQPQHLGRVCIWNLKNCSLPEKTFEFQDGVTSVCFSRFSPFALLVSLISGSVKILDISKTKPEVVVSCDSLSTNEPIWQVKWFLFDSGVEEPIACGSKGQVYLISKNMFVKKTFLSLCKRVGTVKGVPLPKICRNPLAISEKPSVLCLAAKPDNRYNYLVGTDDGCVHLCSTDYWHEHIDVFQAHIGPVHHIKYHPDTSKIFLTVGIDYFVRIWAYGVFEVLFSVQDNDYPIEDADWCPNNPNILVTVASDRISVWDLSRVKLVPQKTIHSPTGSRFTSVTFTSNGSSLICCDISGDVHIFTLSNMPLLYIDKGWALSCTIKKLVLGKKDLYEQLKTMGYPFDIDTSNN